jgi:hypothetical protein
MIHHYRLDRCLLPHYEVRKELQAELSDEDLQTRMHGKSMLLHRT